MEEREGKRVNMERTEEALATDADVIGTGCPFCMTMLTDGVKETRRRAGQRVKDVAELLLEALEARRMSRTLPRIVNAVAPIRVCDVGGWTDTWFARHGAVFNIAVYPYVEVQVRVDDHAEGDERVTIAAENFGHTYAINPDRVVYEKHPLIEAAIDVMRLPATIALRINIFSDAPPGASTGTSAAVSVALIGALDRAGGRRPGTA